MLAEQPESARLATPTAFRAELLAFQLDVIGGGKPLVWPAQHFELFGLKLGKAGAESSARLGSWCGLSLTEWRPKEA